MTKEEEIEYHSLADKRDNNTMTNKEHRRWKILVNKSFLEGLPKVMNELTKMFPIIKQ